MYEWTADLLSFDGGLTLLGPLVAIGLALATKRVIPSLFAAVLVGSVVAADGQLYLSGDPTAIGAAATEGAAHLMYAMNPFATEPPRPSSVPAGPHGAVATLVIGTVRVLADLDKLMISGFSLAVAAMVGVMGRSGGTRALISKVEAYASGRRGAMVTSWLAGAIVFFDDYANCLVVGSAMGPMCDRYKVSRAKLAYIVDATAAPVASLAVISTWVGYEVGLFEDPLNAAGVSVSAFHVFLQALPYRFYCIFTIVFVGAIAISGRDFGPMAVEERRVRALPDPEGEVEDGTGTYWWLAAGPVIVLVGLTFALLIASGREALGPDAVGAPLFAVLGEANPYPPMLMGSLVALVIASIGALTSKSLSAAEVVRGASGSASKVLVALVVLYLAWLLGMLISEAGTGAWLTGLLGDSMPLFLLPVLTFLLAAGTAFSVGSSFFTMGALIPIVLPLALSLEGGVVGPLVLASCAAVLDGAVLGDHASPISDTTILSALGSSVDVVLHVQTQLPYVMAVGVIAVVCGSLPVGLGMPVGVALALGAVAAVATVVALGRSTNPAKSPAP